MPTITLRILLWVLFVPTLSKAQAQPAYDRMPCLLSPSTAKGFSINPQQYLWPQPIIPYEIPPSEFTTAESAQIHSAIAYLNENSNVCLLPRTFEPDYIELARSEGDFNSASSVGYRGGVHRATFAPNQTRRMYLHEFCHLFGLFHEHQRPDRDSFVTVLFDNIPQIYWPQFERGTYARTYEDFIFVVDPAPDLQILGNPVTDGRIDYRFTSTRDRVTILLTDAAGRMVFSDTITVTECGSEGSIDCDDCPSGIYLLTVVDGRERFGRRVRISPR